MTPISFALEILLDCETIEQAHKACRKYIKRLESEQVALPMPAARAAVIPTGPVQAPSTQRLMEAHGAITAPALPPVPASVRIVGGEVQTGANTRGPKKW